MDKKKLQELRDRLVKREDFIPLFEYFVEKSINEVKSGEDQNEEIRFSQFYETYMRGIVSTNFEFVFNYSRSPIEIITINSLILLFIKNGLLNLHVTEPFKDFEKYSADYIQAHKNIMKFSQDYVSMTGDKNFENFGHFFQKYIDIGKYTPDDLHTFEFHRLIVNNFMWDTFYLTLQPRLPNIVVNKKGIIADMIFWKPSDTTFKLVVECDGFTWHKTKENFISDRKRDRLLRTNGYDVIRFSGSEIYSDPINVASEIFDYIENKCPSA